MRSVLVTRPQPAADELAGRLRQEGFEVYLAPLATYVEEGADFSSFASYQALVFTSAEAVRVFAEKSPERAITVFAVGDATAKECARRGFSRVWQAEGSSDDVLRLIRQKKNDLQLKRVLHLSGDEVAQDLAAALIEDGIAVERKIIYRAVYADKMPSDIDKAIISGDIGTVTLFSPRAAAHFARLLQGKDLRGASAHLDVVCLSARVADELKMLPWRKIRVAEKPNMDSVIAALKQEESAEASANALAADPVIAAFGGLRPLANRLGLPASTVQGWKKRGVIPEQRTEEILKAAGEDGLRLETILTKANGDMDDKYKTHAESAAAAERRTGADRRQAQAAPGRDGIIRTAGYSGADRRSGMDRRAFLEQQKRKIAEEKRRFALRSVIGAAAIAAMLVAAAVFIFAPEYMVMRDNAARVAHYEEQMRLIEERFEEMRNAEAQQASLSREISSRLEQIQAQRTAPSPPEEAALPPAPVAAAEVGEIPAVSGDERKAAAFLALIGKVGKLRRTPEGTLAYARAMDRLYEVIPPRLGNLQDANAVIDSARAQDPLLAALFDGIDSAWLGEAALMLGLAEFRASLYQRRPFTDDLAFLGKFGGENAEFAASAAQLEPYAASGVAGGEQLARDFKALAMDIVMAKLQSEDLSVQEKVLKRMDRFVKMRNVADVEGDSVDAIVARADMKLDRGDIGGALKELYGLDGPPKEVAKSWIEAAEGYTAADGLAGAIVKSLATGVKVGIDTPIEDVLPMMTDALAEKAVPIVSPDLQAQDMPGAPALAPFEGE